MKKVRVAVTLGDPAGIGLKVLREALKAFQKHENVSFYFCAPKALISSWRMPDYPNMTLVDLSVPCSRRVRAGSPSIETGRLSMESLSAATSLIRSGFADSLVTLPISKMHIQKAGFQWTGHTEYLQDIFQAPNVEMVFVSDKMKVVPVTQHVALGRVPRLVTRKRVVACGSAMVEMLKAQFKKKRPKIAVCGLNPHAGESGMMGNDEARAILPAIRSLNRSHKGCFHGPYSADTIFNQAQDGIFDLVIAMYHDQALGPFKTIHFSDGAHLTAGLPFIRTSPIHGTAFDRALSGVSDAGSMRKAIELAIKLV